MHIVYVENVEMHNRSIEQEVGVLNRYVPRFSPEEVDQRRMKIELLLI